jgi:hypothetical protein
VKESENGRVDRFLKRTDRWCAFSWRIRDKTCHIIRRIESDSFSSYVSTHDSWEDTISEDEQWVKTNIDKRDRRTVRRIVSENHRNTAAQVKCPISTLPALLFAN